MNPPSRPAGAARRPLPALDPGAGFVLRDYPKGYLLATPRDPDDRVFILRSGRLRVYLAGASRELSLSYLQAGDIYATHTPAYVRTLTPAALWVMPTADFARRLGADPAATPAVMRVLGRLLDNAVGLIDDLAFREVPARLARFLCGLVERHGQPGPDGCRVALELGTEDIASLLGSTRQTVSALLNQWARDGLLRRDGRRALVIRDPAALAARAAPPP